MDPYTRVRLYWSAGRVAQEQAKPRVALEHFRRAVALLGATEDSAHIARAHLSCAGAMIAARKDLAGAAEHIDKAEQLLGSHASPDDLVVIFRMRAMRSARAREFADAVEFATIAIDAADRMPNERGQATWALAEALAGLGDPNADRAFADAVELLTLHGTVRERAQALQAYGTYLEAEGDTAKAAAVRQSAAVTSAKLLERARPAKARIAT
jgi:tetratricopeptide (TPR) repeat protein